MSREAYSEASRFALEVDIAERRKSVVPRCGGL